MAITAAMVKDLREKTGSGMMDCKKALTATDGDMDKAIEWLRENGLAKAAKKAERIAAEGSVAIAVSECGKAAAIVEVNSETDFVAKNEKFQTYINEVAQKALKSESTTVEGFFAESWEEGKTVEEALKEKIAVIGENLKIRRFVKVVEEDGFVASYIHGGGRIGILLAVKSDVINDDIKEAAKNVAMQVAAMNPSYVNRQAVPGDYEAHEMEILKAQVANDPAMASKPANIVEKMLIGRLNKELKEICLVDQAYVKDSSMTVNQYIQSVAKANGAKIELVSFVRYETGEGLEKKNEDFAAEVAAQMGK